MKLYNQSRPETPVPSARLKLRPDHALVALTLSVADLSAQPSLALLSNWAARIEQSVKQVAADATSSIVDFDPPAIAGLLSKGGDEATARLSLSLRLPLAAQATVLQRAERMALVDDVLRSLVLEARKQKPAITLGRATPTYLLSEEALTHARERLVKQWLERLAELSKVSAVTVEGASPTIDVAQRPLTMEEVEVVFEPGGSARFRLPRQGVS